MAVEIYIARHGQNEDNANGILNGHRDLPLTEIGRGQALALGEGIRELGIRFDFVYASPLKRAFETAEIACRVFAPELKPVMMTELIERDFGEMTGKEQSRILELCGDDVLVTDTIKYFLNPKDGESFPQLVERAHILLNKVRSLHDSGNVLLVTHGDFGKMIYAAATGKSWINVLKDFHFGNGELIEITPNDDARLIHVPQHNV